MTSLAHRVDGLAARESARGPAASTPWDWLMLFGSSAARAALALTVSLLLWSSVPAVWGWMPTTVMTSSMAPAIHAGDVVVSMPVVNRAVTPGQVLLVDDPDHPGRLRLHRLSAITESGLYQLKGDANSEVDSTLVHPEAARGIAVIRVPTVGLPVLWLRQGDLVRLLVAAVLVGGLLVIVRWDRSRSRRERRPADLTGLLRPRRHRQTTAATAILSVVVVGAASTILVASPPAHAAFSAPTSNLRNTLASSTFPCLDRAAFPTSYLAYQFNDAPGTVAADSSGNNRPGTLTTGASSAPGTCTPNNSPALHLNGSGQVTTATSITAPQVFGIETWFTTISTTGGKLIGFGDIQKGQSSRYDRHLYMTDDGTVYFGVYNGGNITLNSAPGLNDGKWHLVTATMDSSGMTLYLDGVKIASNTNAAAEATTGWWRIGFDNLNGWPGTHSLFHFTGDLDNTTVYSTTLKPADVANHYSAGR